MRVGCVVLGSLLMSTVAVVDGTALASVVEIAEKLIASELDFYLRVKKACTDIHIDIGVTPEVCKESFAAMQLSVRDSVGFLRGRPKEIVRMYLRRLRESFTRQHEVLLTFVAALRADENFASLESADFGDPWADHFGSFDTAITFCTLTGDMSRLSLPRSSSDRHQLDWLGMQLCITILLILLPVAALVLILNHFARARQ